MLPNLRLVRDATVQLSTELRKSLGCSAAIQMTKMTVNLSFKTQTLFFPLRTGNLEYPLTLHTAP